MAGQDKQKFSNEEMDILKEVASIGSGNAATALSQMVNKRLEIRVPETKIIPVEKFPEQFSNPNEVVVATYMEIFGEISGEIILFFPRDNAMIFGDFLLGKELTREDLVNELSISMFKEIANIVCSAYINSLAKICDLEILPSVPHFSCDMLNAVIDFMLVKLSSKVDEALYVNTSFEVEGHNIDGNMLVILEEESLRKIISALQQKISDN